jgi:hypothetical protein
MAAEMPTTRIEITFVDLGADQMLFESCSDVPRVIALSRIDRITDDEHDPAPRR